MLHQLCIEEQQKVDHAQKKTLLLKATSSKNEISLADLFRMLPLYVKAYFENVHICNLGQKI